MMVSVVCETVHKYIVGYTELLSELFAVCSIMHIFATGNAKSSVLGLEMLVYCQTFEAWSSLVAVLVVVVLVIAV